MIRLRAHTPLLTLGLSLAAIYGVALAIVSRLSQIERPGVIAGALTLDLTVLVPVLYYLLMVRWRGWPAITIVPVFIGSVALAGRLIPDSQHHVLDLMGYGAAVAEVAVVAIIVHKTFQLRRAYRDRKSAGLDVYAGLRQSARPLLGSVAGNVLAYEVAVFYYLVFGWRRAGEAGPGSFTYHREIAYGAVVGAVMMAGVVELVAVHLLVKLWSSLAAWILSGISAYALFWLIGDTHAIRLRPIQVSDTMLHIRLGLRWTIDVPRKLIDRIGAVGEPLPRSTPGYLKALLLGAPNCRIELGAPVEALGPYGLVRRVKTIDLRVDDPRPFEASLKATSTP